MFAKRSFLEWRDAKCGDRAIGSLALAPIARIIIAAALVAINSNTAAAAPTVTPAASTVPAGAPLMFTVVNDGTASPMDWLALYQTSAPDGAYITWQFMNGLKAAAPATGLTSATLAFSAPLTPGTYEVRYFSNNTFARLATSSTITVPAPTITAAAATVAAGASIDFVVLGGPANPTDWVGLFPTSSADTSYIAWQFLNGSTAAPAMGLSGATLRFRAPFIPGTYEARFFRNNTFMRLATSGTVTVALGTASVTPTAATVPAGSPIGFVVAGGPASPLDWVGLYRTTTGDDGYIAWQFLNGTKTAPSTGMNGATLQFMAPITPDTYEVRFFTNNTFVRLATSSAVTVTPVPASVTLAASALSLGAPIGFSIAGGLASPTDWVGLFPSSASDTGYVAWQYLNGRTIPPMIGVSAATLQFASPTAPGTYELRFFSSNTSIRLATSGTVTLTSTASVTVTTPAVTAALIKFVVAGGPSNRGDWVALYSSASPDSAYIAWQYMNGATSHPATGIAGASLWFLAPSTAGTYELRFFSNDTFVKLATSGPVTVGTLPVPTGQTFVSGLSQPVGFVQDPVDPTVQYVVQQAGRIRVVKSGVLQATDFINLSAQVVLSSEQGLLGLAFPPDYATSHRFYASFTGPSGNVVARFTHSANRLIADPASRFDLRWSSGLRYIPQPFANHNGGNIAFGPDGYLYIGRGDGGSGNDPLRNAQNRSSLLGKMLRIDVNVADADPNGFVVPPDNPFVTASPTLPEIWAFGLRNPWRFSFDDGPGGTGALVIGDVGQNAWEEVDYELPNNGGRNYGWVHREAAHPTPGVPPLAPFPGAPVTLTDPIHEYSHATGVSITGGFVYRGAALGAGFNGRYVFADLLGRVWSMAIDATPARIIVSHLVEHTATIGGGTISAFGRDAAGELYIVRYGAGAILKIAP